MNTRCETPISGNFLFRKYFSSKNYEGKGFSFIFNNKFGWWKVRNETPPLFRSKESNSTLRLRERVVSGCKKSLTSGRHSKFALRIGVKIEKLGNKRESIFAATFFRFLKNSVGSRRRGGILEVRNSPAGGPECLRDQSFYNVASGGVFCGFLLEIGQQPRHTMWYEMMSCVLYE